MRVRPERIQNQERAYACCKAMLAVLENAGDEVDKIHAVSKLAEDFNFERNLDNLVIDQVRKYPWLWPDADDTLPTVSQE